MGAAGAALAVRVQRVFADPGRAPGDYRVLADRLWPRGVSRADLDLDEWAKDLAPSTELRRWYGHQVERFEEFAQRYRAELAGVRSQTRLADLTARATQGTLVLLTATRDVEHSGAWVLRTVLLASRPLS